MDETIKTRASELLAKFKLDEKRRVVRELEAESMKPGFWSDSQAAAKKMQKMAGVQKELDEGDMFARLIEEGDEQALLKELERLEFALYLSGPYDGADAIMALHSGQGGTEAMDWTSMLYRMYSRFIERKNWTLEEIDYTPGEEAGIKSITFQVAGRHAYGLLKAEAGVHRLVRQSPFNADKLRQTSFAMAEVLPVVDDTENINIREEELEWDFYRAGGKGGQNVNKVSTAVRLRHIPTGIVVTSQAQRYQGQNREYALKVLQAKLWAKAQEEKLAAEKTIRGASKTPGWGNQIRSYVLHPYHMVKDLRTQYETSNTDRVLDGDIEDFITSYLKKFS